MRYVCPPPSGMLYIFANIVHHSPSEQKAGMNILQAGVKRWCAFAGAQTVSFGTQVNSNVCDCDDQPCINKAQFDSATGQTGQNALTVNPSAIVSGESAVTSPRPSLTT